MRQLCPFASVHSGYVQRNKRFEPVTTTKFTAPSGFDCVQPNAPHDGVMVSFTAATSWLSVNGFGRNANCWFSGRLFSKASSA
jgi:hypothetical protein